MIPHSVVVIVPAAHHAAMAQLGQALGYGPNNFSVELSASGNAPATHFGTHTWAQPGGQFHQLVLAVQAGVTPPGLEPFSAALSETETRLVENSQDALTNWNAALTERGLKKVLTGSELP